MYGTLEEEHGLAKRAMNIYERACGAVSDQDKFDVTIFYYSLRISSKYILTGLSLAIHNLHCESSR